jgi:hypothetical protein
MNNLQSHSLEPVCKDLSEQFERAVEKGDGSEVIDRFRIVLLGHKSDIGGVDALEVSLMQKEILTQLIHVKPDDRPCFFEKQAVESIRAGGFVIGHIQNNLINFLCTKSRTKMIQFITRLDEKLQIELHISFYCEAKSPLELLVEKSTFLP